MMHDEPRPGLTFFRPGEITLLLEPPVQQDERSRLPRLTRRHLQPLRELLASEDVYRRSDKRGDDLFAAEPFRGLDGKRRRLRAAERGGRSRLVLQAVNLATWPGEQGGGVDPKRSIGDVVTVVRKLNDGLIEKPDTMLGDYRLKAVAPNWLALPLTTGW